jgi:dUTP pyrophosphatase
VTDTITIELLHPDARRPERATEASAGYDLCAYLKDQRVNCASHTGITEMPTSANRETGAAYFELQPGTTAMIPLGFKARLPVGYEAQIRPRSGTSFKKGLQIPNAPGTVDADYPDEWKVLVRNPGPNPVRIEHGERIAQMVLARYEVLGLVEGKVERTTSRAGGFGSTGT